MSERPAFTETELEQIEGWAKDDLVGGSIGAQATARRTLRLVEAVRLLMLDAARLHFHHVRQEPGRCRTCAEFDATLSKPDVH